MTYRGITFSNPMVAALRAGQKTQTRRLVTSSYRGTGRSSRSEWCKTLPGDRIWVREQWTIHPPIFGSRYAYGADPLFEGFQGDQPRGWKPARHMPRDASRTTLTVTDVRFQHLQEITDEDAIAEGITTGPLGWGVHAMPGTWTDTSPRDAFARLWDEIHDRHDWTSNPEIVALTFRAEHHA